MTDLGSSQPTNVIIVGAGIAGLSAAIGLRRAGHHVEVFEQSRFTNEIGAALNICPNASRRLGKSLSSKCMEPSFVSTSDISQPIYKRILMDFSTIGLTTLIPLDSK